MGFFAFNLIGGLGVAATVPFEDISPGQVLLEEIRVAVIAESGVVLGGLVKLSGAALRIHSRRSQEAAGPQPPEPPEPEA